MHRLLQEESVNRLIFIGEKVSMVFVERVYLDFPYFLFLVWQLLYFSPFSSVLILIHGYTSKEGRNFVTCYNSYLIFIMFFVRY